MICKEFSQSTLDALIPNTLCSSNKCTIVQERKRERKKGGKQKKSKLSRRHTREPRFFFAHSEILQEILSLVRHFFAFLRIVVHVFTTRMNNYARNKTHIRISVYNKFPSCRLPDRLPYLLDEGTIIYRSRVPYTYYILYRHYTFSCMISRADPITSVSAFPLYYSLSAPVALPVLDVSSQTRFGIIAALVLAHFLVIRGTNWLDYYVLNKDIILSVFFLHMVQHE